MVLANLYVLAWNYDRLKYILPFKTFSTYGIVERPEKYDNKFPFLFFTGVICTAALTVLLALFGYDAMPGNSLKDCKMQFTNTKNEAAGYNFCECIHNNGTPLDECLEEFENATKKTLR